MDVQTRSRHANVSSFRIVVSSGHTISTRPPRARADDQPKAVQLRDRRDKAQSKPNARRVAHLSER
jgi:hypothetical protein